MVIEFDEATINRAIGDLRNIAQELYTRDILGERNLSPLPFRKIDDIADVFENLLREKYADDATGII